jgi:hypothetical protein
MDINAPILRKALEHITAHPEEWRQSIWALKDLCGTECCLAGTIVAQQGYHFIWDNGAAQFAVKPGVEGKRYIPHAAAVELLGRPLHEFISGDAGYAMIKRLFYSTHNLRDLWSLASLMTNGEIEIPEEFL